MSKFIEFPDLQRKKPMSKNNYHDEEEVLDLVRSLHMYIRGNFNKVGFSHKDMYNRLKAVDNNWRPTEGPEYYDFDQAVRNLVKTVLKEYENEIMD